MAEIYRAGPDLGAALANANDQNKPLTDAEIHQRMASPAGTSGVTSIQFDADGKVVAADGHARSHSVLVGGGVPSNMYDVEIGQIQQRVDNLHAEFEKLKPGDPRRDAILREFKELEKEAQLVHKKKLQAIAASESQQQARQAESLTDLRISAEALEADRAELRNREIQRRRRIK